MSAEIFPNYINAEWVSGETFEDRNPADTDRLIGLFVKGTARQVAEAVEAAQAAFPAWSSLQGPARGHYLFKVADLLERNFEQSRSGHDARRGQDVGGSEGRSAALGQHLSLFCR